MASHSHLHVRVAGYTRVRAGGGLGDRLLLLTKWDSFGLGHRPVEGRLHAMKKLPRSRGKLLTVVSEIVYGAGALPWRAPLAREPPLAAPIPPGLCHTRCDRLDIGSRTRLAVSEDKIGTLGTCKHCLRRSAAVGHMRRGRKIDEFAPTGTWSMFLLRLIELFTAKRTYTCVLLQGTYDVRLWSAQGIHRFAIEIQCTEIQNEPRLRNFAALLQPEHWSSLVAPAQPRVVG